MTKSKKLTLTQASKVCGLTTGRLRQLIRSGDLTAELRSLFHIHYYVVSERRVLALKTRPRKKRRFFPKLAVDTHSTTR